MAEVCICGAWTKNRTGICDLCLDEVLTPRPDDLVVHIVDTVERFHQCDLCGAPIDEEGLCPRCATENNEHLGHVVGGMR